MLQVFPMPSSSPVRLRLDTDAGGAVHAEVFDSSGRLIRRLAGGVQGPGLRDLLWDGRDENARPVPAGVYVVQVSTGEARETARVVIVK
jgi:flagellar hook assembly protein FlgD